MTEMRDVDHTHPETADSFGDAFRRGPDVAADGGERDAEPADDNENDTATETATDAETSDAVDATMDEVDHTSAAEGVDRSFERGTEGRSDAV